MPENIHDKGYKRILSRKKNFLSLLKTFIHEAWVSEICEENLDLIDKEFIPKDFKEKEADVIYKLRFKDKEMIFYCLIELQSGVDFTIPFRLLHYMIELLRRIFLDTDPVIRERKDYRLPVIVPIVLYNGSEEWSAVRRFKEYLDGYEIFGDILIDFRYILLDVNRHTDESLFEIGNLVASVFALDKKMDTETILMQRLTKIATVLTRLSQDEQIELMDWIKDVLIKKARTGQKELINEAIEKLKEGESIDMTYAIERFIDEVEEKGIAKGMEKGIAKGREEVAKQMLKEGEPIFKIIKFTGLGEVDLERLKKSANS